MRRRSLATLRELQLLTGGEGRRYVFPALTTSQRPMSENTVNMALRRLGFERETATAHGFRAMARTMATERLGVDPQAIEARLAHAVGNTLGRACNRTTFAEQRRELMVKWPDPGPDQGSSAAFAVAQHAPFESERAAQLGPSPRGVQDEVRPRR